MSSRFTKIYAVFCTLAAIILSALRIAVSLFYTDPATGVYSRASNLPDILNVLTAALIIIAITVPLVLKNKFPLKVESPQNKQSVFFTALLAFVFLLVALFNIYEALTSHKTDIATIVISASGILSALYYLAKIFAKKENRGVVAILAFAPIVWSLATLVAQYFDMTILISSPNRAYHQMALLALASLALAEVREIIGFDNNRLFVPAAGCAGILLSVSSLANLVCTEILAIGETYSLLTHITEFVFALYCFIKLYNAKENVL